MTGSRRDRGHFVILCFSELELLDTFQIGETSNDTTGGDHGMDLFRFETC